MSQKGVLLHANARRVIEVEIPVPCPSGQPGGVNPKNYAHLLSTADPDHLLAADCPFSHLVNAPLVIIYDSAIKQGTASHNTCASRLTTNVENGLEIEIHGNAIALYSSHKDFTIPEWEQFDNVIYDELLEYFGQGVTPQKRDIDRLVDDFKSGKFKYSSFNDEDTNKDDGGDLPGWG